VGPGRYPRSCARRRYANADTYSNTYTYTYTYSHSCVTDAYTHGLAYSYTQGDTKVPAYTASSADPLIPSDR
jgi:hypothetical protein